MPVVGDQPSASVRMRRGRRGVVYVLLAVLIVIVLGLLAVTVDLGAKRLTEAQMRSATDAASVEGLRFRDARDTNGVLMADRDEIRRVLASQAVVRTFDGDNDISVGDEEGQLGAGPLYSQAAGTAGLGELDARARLIPAGLDPNDPETRSVWLVRNMYAPGFSPNDQPVWLELNLANNERHGDMVAGRYTPLGDHSDGRFVGGSWEPYDRRNDGGSLTGDFTEADPLDALDAQEADAFLVRMRRTRMGQTALDRQDGVSSAGPTVPYTFARGTTLFGRDESDSFSPRAAGMTVRATSIAQAQPAIVVGAAQPLGLGVELLDEASLETPVVGLGPLAISRALWDDLAVAPGQTLEVRPNGRRYGLAGSPQSRAAIVLATRLAAPVDAGDTVIQVEAATPIHPGDQFRVRVGQEIMLVTDPDLAPGQWGVERGVDGTPVQVVIDPEDTYVMYAGEIGVGTLASVVRPDRYEERGIAVRRNQGPTVAQLLGTDGGTGAVLGTRFLVPIVEVVNLSTVLGVGGNRRVEVVVGFGQVQISGGTNANRFKITRWPGDLVARNASSTTVPAGSIRPSVGERTVFDVLFAEIEERFGALSPLTDEERAEILDDAGGGLMVRWRGLDDAVQAPSLVRSYGR